MKTILLVECDEEKTWKIIERICVYNKYFKSLNIATEESIAKKCIELYEFDVMIIDSSCKDILDYIEENCQSNFKKKIIILKGLDSNNRKNNYSFNNKTIELDKLDEELEKVFKCS